MKVTPAMAVILHIVWSGLLGLIIAGGTAVIQYNSLHGINIPQDASLFALTLLTGLGSTLISIWHSAQTNSALPQAESDVAGQIQAALEARITPLENALKSHTHPTPPVIPALSSVPPLPIGPAMSVPGATFNPASPSFTITSNSPQAMPLQRDWTAMTPVVKPAQS